MKKIRMVPVWVALMLFLSSCEMSCKLKGDDEPETDAQVKDGARIYNDIEIKSTGVKVEKAYLIFADGEAVPPSNIIDFTQPVTLVLVNNGGWYVDSNRVKLGASERISTERGQVLLDEKDLFEKHPEGIPAKDATRLNIMAKIILKQKVEPLATFIVFFRVWDKKSNAAIEGSYKLYSK